MIASTLCSATYPLYQRKPMPHTPTPWLGRCAAPGWEYIAGFKKPNCKVLSMPPGPDDNDARVHAD